MVTQRLSCGPEGCKPPALKSGAEVQGGIYTSRIHAWLATHPVGFRANRGTPTLEGCP